MPKLELENKELSTLTDALYEFLISLRYKARIRGDRAERMYLDRRVHRLEDIYQKLIDAD